MERRADQVRQRLREVDPMSLRMAKVQSATGRAEEQLRKKTVAAEQAERDRQQAQQRRDQLVEDMRVLSEEMADQRGVDWADPMDQGEDYEAGDGWRWWYGNSSAGDYWDHQEPQEEAQPALVTQVQQLSEVVMEMQRHFAAFVRWGCWERRGPGLAGDRVAAAGLNGNTESAQEGPYFHLNPGSSAQGQKVQGQVAHAAKLCRPAGSRAGFSRRLSGGKCIVALDRIRGSIPEGIMNWDDLLCASIVGMLPLGVLDNFVQEATVAEHELEQEVLSFVLYTDGSASMSGGWPKEQALASWLVIVLAQCHSRLVPLFACAAPVELDPAGPSLHLGASRRINNAGEVSAVTAAFLVIHFLRSLPGCAGLPAIVRSDSLTTLQLVQLQARASGNAVLVRNARLLKTPCTELQHLFSHTGDLWNEVADVMSKMACRCVRMAPEALACLLFEAGTRLAGTGACERVDFQAGSMCGVESAHLFWESVQQEPDSLELARQEWKRGLVAVAGSSVVVKVVTANVLTLHLSEERKVGQNFTARSRELQHLADQASVDILGVQEARTASARGDGDQYVILSSGSDGRGNYGCEAWFAVRLLRDRATLTPWVSQPRILGVALRSRQLNVDVLVAHAPVESSPQEVRTEWWRALHKAASGRRTKAPLILLVDANGRLGSICTESVGGVEPDVESPNGEELHLFLTEWQLFAANTFWPLGQDTWQSTRDSQCRSDYFCLPLQWKSDVASCSIETELPLALVSKVDHFAVQVTVCVGGSSSSEPFVPRRVTAASCELSSVVNERLSCWSKPPVSQLCMALNGRPVARRRESTSGFLTVRGVRFVPELRCGS